MVLPTVATSSLRFKSRRVIFCVIGGGLYAPRPVEPASPRGAQFQATGVITLTLPVGSVRIVIWFGLPAPGGPATTINAGVGKGGAERVPSPRNVITPPWGVATISMWFFGIDKTGASGTGVGVPGGGSGRVPKAVVRVWSESVGAPTVRVTVAPTLRRMAFIRAAISVDWIWKASLRS